MDGKIILIYGRVLLGQTVAIGQLDKLGQKAEIVKRNPCIF